MSDRLASSPVAGAARDSIRTAEGIGGAFLVAQFLPSMSGGDMEKSITGLIVVAVSAALAWFGKKMRDDGVVSGGPV